MIDRNHPSVQAAARTMHQAQNEIDGLDVRWEDEDPNTRSNWCNEALSALTAALPHLTADDLRNTEAGKALMAEAWQEGAMAHAEATGHLTPGARHIINETMRAANPYKENP